MAWRACKVGVAETRAAKAEMLRTIGSMTGKDRECGQRQTRERQNERARIGDASPAVLFQSVVMQLVSYSLGKKSCNINV